MAARVAVLDANVLDGIELQAVATELAVWKIDSSSFDRFVIEVLDMGSGDDLALPDLRPETCTPSCGAYL